MKKVYIDDYSKPNLITGITAFVVILIIALYYKSLLVGIGATIMVLVYALLYYADPNILEINSNGIYYQGADDTVRIFLWDNILGIVRVIDDRYSSKEFDFVYIISDTHSLKIDANFKRYKEIVEDFREIAGQRFLEEKNITIKEKDIPAFRERLSARLLSSCSLQSNDTDLS